MDALEKFFKACPVDSGAAYVVVQHLSPDHKSMMSNLLARHTEMPVTVVEDDMPIEADHELRPRLTFPTRKKALLGVAE